MTERGGIGGARGEKGIRGRDGAEEAACGDTEVWRAQQV